MVLALGVGRRGGGAADVDDSNRFYYFHGVVTRDNTVMAVAAAAMKLRSSEQMPNKGVQDVLFGDIAGRQRRGHLMEIRLGGTVYGANPAGTDGEYVSRCRVVWTAEVGHEAVILILIFVVGRAVIVRVHGGDGEVVPSKRYCKGVVTIAIVDDELAASMYQFC